MKKHNLFLLSLAFATPLLAFANLDVQKNASLLKAPQAKSTTESSFTTNYDEPYRPQFHYTPPVGWMNDVNGVWFYNGIYHLSYQAYPHSLDGLNKHWGHATSTDMMHWVEQPIMLEPGVNVPGECYSGSTVIDINNTSGFQTGTNPPLVTVYTATTKGTCLAYSNDLGATWVAYSGNPVAVGGPNANTRDPHVFWYAPTSKWVCLLYENGTSFYTSSDLKAWTKTSNLSFGYECPDFFELPVDGGSTKKWVLMEADSKYFVGTFNGTTFTPDAGGPYTMVNNSGIGAGFYASQTFFANNFPDNRIVQMGWMSGLTPGNTAPWTHNATFPCDVTLKTFPEGVRAARLPIAAISNLYVNTQTWETQTLASSQNLFAGKLSKCYDLEVVFDVSGTNATILTFQLANRTLTYDMQNQTLLGASLKPINNLVKIRLLVDCGELEIFGNDGQFSYAENFKFSLTNSSISMSGNGSVKLVSARYSNVNRTWTGTASNAYADDPVNSGTTYTGNWIVASGESGYLNTTLHVSNTTGAYTEYAFTGTQISWYGLKNNDLGMATVYIDGVLAADNIDCYSTERMVQLLFTKTDLSAGNHVIKVLVKGTKNAASAGTALVHDYFGTVSTLKSATAADDADPKTVYTGTWVTDVNGIYYNTTCHVSNTTGSYFQYDFTGTQVYWYGLKNSDLGMAAVYIDGVLAADNIDCYSTTKAINLLFCKTNLLNTTHTVKVVVKGTKNTASAGTAIVHDYFDFPVISPLYVDDSDSRTIYTGTWGTDKNAIYYNSTCHYGNSSNGAIEFNFNGTQVSWYALTNNDLGIAGIYIDGVWVKDVDCYGTDRLVHMLYTNNALTKGNHTIKVAVKGTKNTASSGIYLVHDYFMVPDVASIDVSGNLAFGSVKQNANLTKTLTISNTSNSPLVVSSLTIPDGFTADWTSGEVSVQKDQKVTITFAPSEVKTYTGTIKVISNAEGGFDEIAVSGTGTFSTTIAELGALKMKIYPNPVKNTLRVTTNEASNIELSDVTAKVILNKEVTGTTTSIDMSAFKSGVYFLKANNNKGKSSIEKVVKI